MANPKTKLERMVYATYDFGVNEILDKCSSKKQKIEYLRELEKDIRKLWKYYQEEMKGKRITKTRIRSGKKILVAIKREFEPTPTEKKG